MTDKKKPNTAKDVKRAKDAKHTASSIGLALAENPLFSGIPVEKIDEVLASLGAYERTYEADEIMIHMGEYASRMGFVISGIVRVGYLNEDGELSYIRRLEQGDDFAAAVACTGVPSVMQVQAVSASSILWLEFKNFAESSAFSAGSQKTAASASASRLRANLMKSIAQKGVFMNQRMQMLSHRSLRERIRQYLRERVKEQEDAASSLNVPSTLGTQDDAKTSDSLCASSALSAANTPSAASCADALESLVVAIPFSRGDLAQYLGVNRSALSRELGRMRDEGILLLTDTGVKILSQNWLWD